MHVLVTSKNAKRLGKPAGSFISYDEAPEWLRKSVDAMRKPLSAEASERIERQLAADLELAKHIREPFGAAL